MLSALPIVGLGNCCCCLWIVSGGVLAAYLDQQSDPRPITVGRGARTGVLSGIIGAVVWLIASTALNALMAPLQQWLAGEVIRTARDLPPEVREMLESFGARSPVGLAFIFAAFLCASATFSTLGGVLGAAFFRNDVPPAVGGATPPPLPPQ